MTHPISGPNQRVDVWPRTNRVLPWLMAGLLAMIYLVPFDSITLPIHLPVDSDLDRFALGFAFLVWLCVALAGRSRPSFRRSTVNAALLLLVTVSVLSIAFNLRPLVWDGEIKIALKNFSLLGSFVVFFYICATSIKSGEVRGYAKLIVVLACLTAFGTLIEYDTGTNLFFSIASDIFGSAHVSRSGISLYAAASASVSSRPSVTGPAVHGLADATLMSAAIPVALTFAASAHRRREAAIWLLAVGLLLGGNVATGRKTGLLVPLISILILLAYEPRRYARYLPLLVVAFLIVELAAPSAISRLWLQITTASSSSSTQTRVSDFGAIQPYILSHLLIGRGYGSFDPFKYRILDDQMLDWLVGTGVIGAASFIGVVFSVALTAHRASKRFVTNRRLMHAIVAFAVGFLISNVTYDTFSFRQAPYIFFFMAALAVAHSSQLTVQGTGDQDVTHRSHSLSRIGTEPALVTGGISNVQSEALPFPDVAD